MVLISFSLSALAAPSANPSASDLWAKYREKARPYIQQYLGDEWAIKLLGEIKLPQTLPDIPQLTEDTKVMVSVDETKVGKPIADAKVREKFDYLFLHELFQTVRNEKIAQDVLATWMNSLSQGGSREGVYQAIVLDNIYGGMENRDYPINDGVIRFTVSFMPRFLGTKTSAQGLEGVNFYRLKREVTNLSLKMMDTLASRNPQDLYRWYAVFSSEMAEQFPTALNNSTRSNKQFDFHQKWAQTAPYQHIKSEVMIKIQLIYNSLY